MILNSYSNNLRTEKNVSVQTLLQNNYGIGFQKSVEICRIIGVCKNCKSYDLDAEQIEKLNQYLLNEIKLVGRELKKKLAKNFEVLVEIKSYKGLRKVKGYPCRGQRTHTNSKTSKKKFK